MKFNTIKYEISESVATITINRPDVLNALNTSVLEELLDAANFAASDSHVKAVIITGEGRAFVAGADISEMKEYTPQQGYSFSYLGHSVMNALADMPKPVIAAVNGFALGGGTELALACDFIYASNKAKFGQPEANLGVIPGFGGTQRLTRAVGIAKARELIYTGAVIDAEEAKRIGLVLEVYAPEELMAKVKDKANLIASKSPCALSFAKSVMNKGAEVSLEAALELEKHAFGALFGTYDKNEGMSAFIEKRQPKFTGK